MRDRELANSVYQRIGIPMADWPRHFAIDSQHPQSQRPSGKLSDEARMCYRVILATYGEA